MDLGCDFVFLCFLYIINRNMVPYIFCFKFESVLWFYAILHSWFLILPCIICFFYSFLWYEHEGISKSSIFNVFPQKVLPFHRTILFICNPSILPASPFSFTFWISCPALSSCIYYVGHVRCLPVANVSLWIRRTMLINIFRQYRYFIPREHPDPLGAFHCWYLFNLTSVLFCGYFVTQH